MARYDLLVNQGATWAWAWPITVQGDPVDLTGWSARAQVRPSKSDNTVLHEWSTEDGTASIANSRVTLYLTPAESSAWTWYTGVYDIELQDPDGHVYRISEGSIVVSREVTR